MGLYMRSTSQQTMQSCLLAARQEEIAPGPLQSQNLLTCTSAAQTDLAPSLAILLGVPIPFVNVGKVQPSILALHPEHASEAALLEILQCDAAQVSSSLAFVWNLWMLPTCISVQPMPASRVQCCINSASRCAVIPWGPAPLLSL